MNDQANQQNKEKKPFKAGDYNGGLPLPSTNTKEQTMAQVERANKRFKMGKYSNNWENECAQYQQSLKVTQMSFWPKDEG